MHLCRPWISSGISTHLQGAAACCLQVASLDGGDPSFEGTEAGTRLFFGRRKSLGAREIAQRLRALAALVEDPGSGSF